METNKRRGKRERGVCGGKYGVTEVKTMFLGENAGACVSERLVS